MDTPAPVIAEEDARPERADAPAIAEEDAPAERADAPATSEEHAPAERADAPAIDEGDAPAELADAPAIDEEDAPAERADAPLTGAAAAPVVFHHPMSAPSSIGTPSSIGILAPSSIKFTLTFGFLKNGRVVFIQNHLHFEIFLS